MSWWKSKPAEDSKPADDRASRKAERARVANDLGINLEHSTPDERPAIKERLANLDKEFGEDSR